MSYRDDLEAMQARLQQLEGELDGVRRDRARLQRAVLDEPRLVTELDRLRRTLHARAPRHLPLLDNVRVASPCHERWDEMTGDAQARHCARCDKSVYNLSAMTRDAAEALLRQREGRICVRYYRRVDGTILTADCPVGVRRKRVQLAAAAGALTALAAGVAASFARAGEAPPPVALSRQVPTPTAPSVPATLSPTPDTVVQGQSELIPEMGDIPAPARPAPTAPAHRARGMMGQGVLRR
ncbi:MAG: hypothetical protein R3A48_03710 [Polyangiales bacterium]